MSERLLALEGVALARGGKLLFEALDLVLAPGDAALVTGPNGIGKSSLLRLAAGLLKPTAGRVALSSAALADDQLALDERLPLARALGFWAAFDGGNAITGMERMGLLELADVPVRLLSTGQRRRASLARVISSDRPLWILDEPANGLDPDGLDRLAAVLAEARRSGRAILAASHQPIGLDGGLEVRLG